MCKLDINKLRKCWRRPLGTFSLLKALTRTFPSQHIAFCEISLTGIVQLFIISLDFDLNLPTIESQSHLSGKGLKCGCDIVPGEARSEAGVIMIIMRTLTLSGT